MAGVGITEEATSSSAGGARKDESEALDVSASASASPAAPETPSMPQPGVEHRVRMVTRAFGPAFMRPSGLPPLLSRVSHFDDLDEISRDAWGDSALAASAEALGLCGKDSPDLDGEALAALRSNLLNASSFLVSHWSDVLADALAERAALKRELHLRCEATQRLHSLLLEPVDPALPRHRDLLGRIFSTGDALRARITHAEPEDFSLDSTAWRFLGFATKPPLPDFEETSVRALGLEVFAAYLEACPQSASAIYERIHGADPAAPDAHYYLFARAALATVAELARAL
jgi:hypothetical protein